MNAFIISLFGFVSIVFGIAGIYLLATRTKRNLHNRLEKVTDLSLKLKPESESESEKGQKKVKESVLRKVGKIFFRKNMTKQIEEQLSKAGFPLRGEEFLVIWMVAALAPVSLIYLLTRNMVLVMLVYLMGVLIPPFMVSSAQQKRLKKFNQQISDSLSIMSNALRAGFSFMQAMETVSREMPDPIAKEFARTYREINLGTPTEEALQKMVKRVGSDDLDLLVTAVLIQRQVGGNLAEILDNISGTIRERIRIKGEIKTLTAQGRISGLIIGLIPPILAVLLLLINAEYMKTLFQTQAGWIMLAVGAFTEMIGIMLIKKIISIDF